MLCVVTYISSEVYATLIIRYILLASKYRLNSHRLVCLRLPVDLYYWFTDWSVDVLIHIIVDQLLFPCMSACVLVCVLSLIHI